MSKDDVNSAVPQPAPKPEECRPVPFDPRKVYYDKDGDPCLPIPKSRMEA